MKVRIEFDPCTEESFFDSVEITSACSNGEDVADLILDILKVTNFARTAVAASMVDLLIDRDEFWSTKSVESIHKSIDCVLEKYKAE